MAVTIDIERAHEGAVFRDTISLTDAEHAALTPEQIEAMKDARFANWIAAMTASEE